MTYYEQKDLEDLATEVVKYMPSLAPFYKSEQTLTEYSKTANIYNPNPVYLERQKRFKDNLKIKIGRIFNEQERARLRINLDESSGLIGGMVDHHGVLDHPLLLSVHLVSNFYKLFTRDKDGDILTFATGNVPLNEPFRKRGIMLHGKKINLFP